MNTLTEEQIAFAKNRAKVHLERSILSLSVILGIDPDSIGDDFVIPVESDNPSYYGYVSIISQISALSKLS
jgi:hypothetical protein